MSVCRIKKRERTRFQKVGGKGSEMGSRLENVLRVQPILRRDCVVAQCQGQAKDQGCRGRKKSLTKV